MIVQQQICQIGLGMEERGLTPEWDSENLKADPDNLLSGRGLSVDTCYLESLCFSD
jgi:hypothetical protein